MRISSLLLLTSLMVSATPALADRDRHFHHSWHDGHWVHDRHDGRLGWWWVLGTNWHWYQEPTHTVIVQQPAPPPQVIVTAAPPAPAPAPVAVVQPVLYYCRATGTYYPETMTCPGGWMTQVSAAPPSPTP